MGRFRNWLLALSVVGASLPGCCALKFKSEPGFTSTSLTHTTFKTEPTFTPEIFNHQRIPVDRKRLAPGYLFVDPIWESRGWGPQIYESDGTLIWQGPDIRRSQNLHVCDYLGEKGKHLCFSNRGSPHRLPKNIYPHKGIPSYRYNLNNVMDNSYRFVDRNYTHSAYHNLPLNSHGFEQVNDGHSALGLYIRPEAMDLRVYGGVKNGWVSDECFEEIDLKTKEPLLHWCWMESGLKVWETQTFFNHSAAWRIKHPENTTIPNAGRGNRNRPWDFLHVNAIAKNDQGDYYVSVRHADQIVKVAGYNNTQGVEPASVLWRLGGKGNMFEFKGFPFADKPPFSRTHDVRTVSVNGSEEVISLMNNAWEGTSMPSQSYSDGQIIRVNTDTMTATLVQSYKHPSNLVTPGRGSVQKLPNGNVLVGWGKISQFTEYTADGTILQHVRYGQRAIPHAEFSYRVLKAPWVGAPHWRPKLAVELHTAGSRPAFGVPRPLNAYVSWNGATEVSRWRFYLAPSHGGPWRDAHVADRAGFETSARVPRDVCREMFIYADALDAHGKRLKRTNAHRIKRWDPMCEPFRLEFLGAFACVLVSIELLVLCFQRGLFAALWRNFDYVPVGPVSGDETVERKYDQKHEYSKVSENSAA